jgi:hypothetical protein
MAKPFSEEVFEYGHAHNIPVVYVVPSRSESDDGSAELRNRGREVLRENLGRFGIVHLPSYVRVDSQGVIQSIWTGTVSSAKHNMVFASIVSGNSLEQYKSINRNELSDYLAKEPEAQMLGLSEIGKASGMTSLPFDELGVRAKYELDKTRPVVIDCKTALEPLACQDAGMRLVKEDFQHVVVVDLERRTSDCEP